MEVMVEGGWQLLWVLLRIEGDQTMGVIFFFVCILIPSCIGRTDVGRLINKSLGDVEVRLRIQRLWEGREDVLLDHTQSASQCKRMHVSLDCVCVSVCACSNVHALPPNALLLACYILSERVWDQSEVGWLVSPFPVDVMCHQQPSAAIHCLLFYVRWGVILLLW